MKNEFLNRAIQTLRLHGLIWAVLIPSAYISFLSIKFIHEVVGHGISSLLLGIEWHGFGLTSVSVTIPADMAPLNLSVYYLAGNISVLLLGVILFKFISRRINRPSLRFMIVTVATASFLTSALPAALLFWISESDYISFLSVIGLDSLLSTALFSLSGSVLFFYTASYSITRLLEEAWTGLEEPKNRYGSAFLTLGIPLNVMFIALIFYNSSISPNTGMLTLSAVMGMSFNLMLPSAAAHVRLQPDKRRIRKVGLMILTYIAIFLFILHYTTMDKMIIWSAP